MSRPLGSRYRVGAPIGSGGPGEVFLGEDELGEIYAIKVLRPDLARDADMVAQFAFERGRLQRLRGNHLVPVHDVVIEGDVLAVVMEMVPGGNLRAALANGALPPAEVSRIGAAMAKGLADIHAMGMAHGDLKPQNVLLDERFKPPKPRLTDALLAYPPHARPDSLPYLAPERWQGATPARAGDMYALGMVLYELACGVPAYAGDPADLAQSHLDHGPGRPVGVPDGLWALIVELTARDPMRRPFSSSLIAERLEELAASTAGMAAAPSLRTPPPPVPLIAPPAAAPPPPPAAPASASDATAALPPIVAPAPAPPPAPAPAWASDTTAAFPPVAASNPAAAPAPAKAPSWEDAVAAAATPAPVLASSSYRRSGERRRTYVAAGVLALLLGAGAVWAVMNTGGETTAVEPVTPQVILPVVTPTPSETPSFDPFATASPT
ncbi:MAG: serine/threonine-protein kinase, partial [Sporichthyaceae bacterium]